MNLNEEQRDALAELVNIGFGRAAASLSTLIGQKIELHAPEVRLFHPDELKSALGSLISSQSVIVHQTFTGSLRGSVFLLMDMKSVTSLVDLLGGGSGESHRFSASDREALIEIGNILLNAYVGSFGNLLKVQIRFSLPKLFMDSFETAIQELSLDPSRYLLLVKTEFRLLKGDVSGYVALITGEDSLELLIQRMLAEA